MPLANRFAAYLVVLVATLSGGGSLIVFGAFLITRPFTVIHFNLSEPLVLLWDGFLSAAFFLQHSGMIRSSFRSWLSSILPAYYYSATYAIASGTVLTAAVVLWQPSHTTLFEAQGLLRIPFHIAFLLAIGGFAWGVWALGEFDPFGRISVLSHRNGKPQASRLVVRGPYLWVRHPLYLFMLVLIWATPSLSLDRLLFNVLWTFWIVVGSYLEEKDLVTEFGENYRHYQDTVPMLLPWKGPVGKIFEAP
jgi:protein-S-isoprenylcysteine O-methyltransferase Ste14